jgi:hypothetical protein
MQNWVCEQRLLWMLTLNHSLGENAAGNARKKVGTIQPLVRHVPNKQYVAKEAASGRDVPALCTPSAPSRLFQRVEFSRAFD